MPDGPRPADAASTRSRTSADAPCSAAAFGTQGLAARCMASGLRWLSFVHITKPNIFKKSSLRQCRQCLAHGAPAGAPTNTQLNTANGSTPDSAGSAWRVAHRLAPAHALVVLIVDKYAVQELAARAQASASANQQGLSVRIAQWEGRRAGQ